MLRREVSQGKAINLGLAAEINKTREKDTKLPSPTERPRMTPKITVIQGRIKETLQEYT